MSAIEKAWYKGAWWLYLLLPVSWLFALLAAQRQRVLSARAARENLQVPVVVVGNLSVGGTGKTPVILTLSKALQETGLKVGIVSRGYGARSANFPLQVDEQHTAEEVGDEPLLIHTLSHCPVVVDPDRSRACRYLIKHNEVNVILSDDGLQHYAMPRDFELVVVDGERLFGNGMRLPAGPLREPISRLATVDAILVNNGTSQQDHSEKVATLAGDTPVFAMQLRPRMLVNLKSGEQRPFSGAPFKMGDRVQAVAGIGNPERFFRLVDDLPYTVEHFAFADHHPFREADFAARGIDLARPIVMTEKDGIKCRSFANDHFWVLHVEVQLPEALQDLVRNLIEKPGSTSPDTDPVTE